MPASVLTGSIIDRFEEIVSRHSTRLAVSDGRCDLSYAELARIVERIAAATAAAAQGPGPVAIVLPNGAYFAAAVLGALASGRGYVPLDTSEALERNRFIAVQSGAAVVISIGGLADRLREFFPQRLPVLMVDSLGETSKAKCPRSAPEDLSCVIYTSGSTGVPKGAYHSHRTLLYIIMQITNCLHVSGDDRLINATGPSFVGATKNIFSALLNGASVHMLPPLQPEGLVNEIEGRGITILRVSPTLVRRIAEVLHPHQLLDSVRLVELSAERAEWSDHDICRQVFRPDTVLATQLTSTEGDATRWIIDPALRVPGEPLPVGHIIPDRSLTIVDDHGRLMMDGEVGELVIKSRYVALGYWRDPDATARRFAIDPIDPDTRMYKTGDLARRRPNGLFEYIGRKDDQIKLSGHRIEPGEIATTLRDYAGVRDAFVMVRKNDDGSVRSLAAYVEARPDIRDLSPRDLKAMLKGRLPPYMIPASIQLIDQLPRLPNLKVDRSRLAEIDAGCASRQPAACETETEAQIAAVWADAFHLAEVGRSEDFYELGGDSLIASLIAARVYSETGVELDLETFADHPTVADLAGFVDRHRSLRNQYQSPIRAGEGEAKFPLSFAQQRIWDFCRANSAGYVVSALYNILGPLDTELLRLCMNKLVARHELLRTTFEEGDSGPLQVVHPAGEALLTVRDLTAAANPTAATRDLIAKYASQSLDLQRGPLLRFALIKTSGNEHRLLRVIHHIIYDASSWKIYMEELAELYAAAARGEEPQKQDDAQPQYADYARWQRESFHADAPACANMISWGRNELNQAPEPFEWPDRRVLSSARVDPSEGHHSCGIDEADWQRMADIAIEQKVTLFVVWLAAFSSFLCIETRRNDIVIGTYVSNRKRPELQRVFGDFSNLVTLRVRGADGKSFRGWVSATRDLLASATSYSEVPYEELRRSFAAANRALPDIRMIFQAAAPERPLQFAGLKVALEERNFRGMPWGFTFTLLPTRHECRFRFDASRYDPVAVHAAGERWQRFAALVARRPDVPMEQ
jgi:amino acid adenylation domain-containing protein